MSENGNAVITTNVSIIDGTSNTEMLVAQESARHETSLALRDEVSQALLAIELRLLALRVASKVNTRDLKKEIAETQRLVRESAKIIRRLTP